MPERRWICPDLRGHGESPSTPPWRTENHVADLLAVLDAHGVERADVVGHSFGGHLAIHLLALAPERVGRVVLLDPASALDPVHAEQGALQYARGPGWTTREDAEAEISTWFPNEESQPDRQPEIDRNLHHDADGRWRMRFSPVVVVAAYGEMCRPLPELPERDVLLVEADPAHSTVNDALRDHLGRRLGDRVGRRWSSAPPTCSSARTWRDGGGDRAVPQRLRGALSGRTCAGTSACPWAGTPC